LYHAIALIGYNDNKKTFLLKNSYGTEWGNGGYIDISYNDLSNALLEAWTCESKLM
jgi:C1A family cysteine protease